ncbi:MAG: cyanobactin biosynthesis PatC/TenC/TruC family protein [Okeania sp. SIO1H6]|nr:cyanobactin biosynthesis PatC/TenC/TruC family protein [Okeania sp. SIO1H4]NET17188.1 cyanobactin biosynthesis PatC/TenC/TruC family protein [Okeania sp. SIO1H6]NET23722.1 cyanobactin biosynthesis PatC/TenC/TruC family protein [Okeania sp. SIO1H5]NET97543.1 cyanobactin biosynthesis PatC/TenC/TruC family protein [Okeania sp. SIO1H2]
MFSGSNNTLLLILSAPVTKLEYLPIIFHFQQPEPEAEDQTILATGLEDYARWKIMFKDHKREDDPPFRRGRIWA